MANRLHIVPENVAGDFFVDRTCIDCDTCRQIAPETFAEGDNYAFVFQQPESEQSRRLALQALVSCPTGSIGCDSDNAAAVMGDFPLLIEGDVYYCGFNSPKSYGGNAYFIRHPKGNWLVDSPKFQSRLVKRIEEWGGISQIFLTHADDVAEAERFAKYFGAQRTIHWFEKYSQPDAETFLNGTEPIELAPGFVAIPTPGHTAGHTVLLYADRFLFTGDHLYWDRHERRLAAFHDYCWHSWPEQIESMQRLMDYQFEWVLPGHGQRGKLTVEESKKQLNQLVERMQAAK